MKRSHVLIKYSAIGSSVLNGRITYARNQFFRQKVSQLNAEIERKDKISALSLSIFGLIVTT
jgi:hypothetical protein